MYQCLHLTFYSTTKLKDTCTTWNFYPFTYQSSKAPVVLLNKKLYPYCLVLVGSMNGFEHDFTIELKKIEGLMMKDWLKCQISPLVKYRQKPKPNTWGKSSFSNTNTNAVQIKN